MDDYTWQSMLQQRHNRFKRQNFVLLFVFAAALGTVIWYLGFFLRTPEYALRQAQSAWQKQDAEAFSYYVNLNVLTSRAYDDLTVDLFAYDSALTPQTKVMFEKFYILIKPQLTQGTEETILRRLADGAWSLPEKNDLLKGRQLGIDYERFLERSQLRNTTFVSIDRVERHGTTALAEITVREDYTQTEATLTLSMEQAEDGHWQVAYIKNYRQYLDTVSPVQNRDIADYIASTQSIVNAYNTMFRGQQEQFRALARTRSGNPSDSQRKKMRDLIVSSIIPSLQQRQAELDLIAIPPGAQYLAAQRRLSTETTISAWEHFLQGLSTGDQNEFDTAEALHKQELAIDLRVDDIIHHTALSKNIPNLP